MRDYMDGLLDFITNVNVCSEDAQRNNALAIVGDSFLQILEWVDNAADEGEYRQSSVLKAGVEAYISILSGCEQHISRSRAAKLISQL